MAEGAHGLLYACGKRTNGVLEVHQDLQGKRIRGIFGAKDQSAAVVDSWEIDWQDCRHRTQVLEQEMVSLKFSNTPIHQIAFGSKHRVILTGEGELFSWGVRDTVFSCGELGQVLSSWHPVTLTPRTQAESRLHTEPENDVFIEARDQDPSSNICIPRRVHYSKDLCFTRIACGAEHSVAITSNGDLYAWGRNFEGQLGHRSKTLSDNLNFLQNGICAWPKYVGAFLGKPVRDVCCGERFTITLLADGSVYRCGERFTGTTRHPSDKSDGSVHLLLASGSDGSPFQGIAAGAMHALGVTKSGNIYAWGLNTYGQLGLGADHGDSSSTLRPLNSTKSWQKIFAGGHYSAALTTEGQLFTWGNGRHGQLGHNGIMCEYSPRCVEALQRVTITNVVCSHHDLFAFAPMRVTAISPQAGEVSGGYEIRISGCGFWPSDDLTVRFIPLTEGRLPRGNLAVFDEHTGDVVCRVPKFSLSGEFAVEVAVDGKHFTSDGHRFEAFKNPVVENISLDDAQFGGGDELTIAVVGDIPLCCTQPMLRLIQDTTQESVTRLEKTTSFLVTGSGKRGVADNELSTISFVMPAIEPCDDIMRFTMEISYNNGLQFVPIISPGKSDSSEDYNPHVISFHNARVIRCRPNSFLSRALPQVFTITIHHLLRDHLDRVSVGLEVTELNISDPEAEARVDVSLPIVKLGGDSITCEIPPLRDWKLTKRDSKTHERVVVSTDWWKFVSRWGFQTRLSVSMNNKRSHIPSTCSVYGLTGMGRLLTAFPGCGPLSGGTQVSIASDYFHFDSDDVVVLLQWRDRETRVPARCISPEHSDQQSYSPLERRVIFHAPPLPFELHGISHDGPQAVDSPAEETINLEDREEVTIFVALDGVHFQMDSSLRFIYCIAPEIHEISPVEAEPGTKMLIRADRFATSGAAWVRLTAPSVGISHIVPVEIVENQQTTEFVLPPLPIPSEDTVFVAFSIDGQQFGIRPGATDGDSTSRESTLSFRYRTS